jgi:hypothetical protein
MKKIIGIVMFAVLMLGTVTIGYAQPGDWRGGIRERIHDTNRRIDRGVERGTLTYPEARRLKGELGRIQYRIDRMRADGHLSPGERDRINSDLDRLNREISREKHDYDRRGDGHGEYEHRRY